MQAIKGVVGVIGNPGFFNFMKDIEPPKRKGFDVAFDYFDSRDPALMRMIDERKALLDVLIVGPTYGPPIRQAYPLLPQVTLFPSLVDILLAVRKAAEFDQRVCVLSPYHLDDFHRVRSVFRSDWNIEHIQYTAENPLPQQLVSLRENNFSSVVGGFGVCHYAKEYGLYPFLYYDKKTLRNLITEAVKIIKIKTAQMEINENLRRIIDVSDVGLLVINADGAISYSNKITLDLFGTDFAHIVGKKLFDLFPALKGHPLREEAGVFYLSGQELLCDTVSLSQGQTVYRFKDVKRVERASYEVRKKVFNGKKRAKHSFSDIVGSEIQGAVALARSYAVSSDANVLITGPTGTGKELFASSLHNSSSRAKENFIAINCAALPENLLESELFGYESGAFTGARRQGKRGLMELAHKGTLFLDEVTEIPYALQAKLLRVLEEKEVLHVGGEEFIPIDVRVIAATNRRLEDEIRVNRFRADLYYRLATLVLEIPPLSKRPGDILEIMDHYLGSKDMPAERREAVKKTVCACYENYDWPGNVRELQNVLERAVTFINYYGDISLPAGELIRKLAASLAGSGTPSPRADQPAAAEDRRRMVSAEKIAETVLACGGNKSLAAKRLGISRSTLWRRLRA